jgi:protein-tyrosine phosphatase
LNSVLLKYNNDVYKIVILYKLSVIQCFIDEEYVIVEKETKKETKEKIEDDWSEINFYDDYLK